MANSNWNPAYDGPDGVFAGYGEYDTPKPTEETTMNPFERLEELTDATVEIKGFPGASWNVFIRPFGMGFPLVKGEADSLVDAVKQAIALWEAK